MTKLQRRVPLALVALLAWMPATGSAQVQVMVRPSVSVSPPLPDDHAQRCQAAIDLAVIAAESGLADLSLETMRRGMAKGPPVSRVALGGLLGGPSSRSSASVNPFGGPAGDDSATTQVRLAKRLLHLHEVWSEQQLDPQLAYTAWKELILPPGRPNEAFAYPTEPPPSNSQSYSNVTFDVEQPKVSDCGAAALVQWAQRAGQEEDLRAEMAARETLPGASQTVLLLKVLFAQQEESPLEEAESLCDVLATKPKALVGEPNSELLFGQVWKMLDRLEPDSEARSKLLDAVLEATQSEQNWFSNRWLQFLVAKRLRDSLQEGDIELFRRATAIALSRYDGIRSNNSEWLASVESNMYGEAAKRAFAAGQTRLGGECLRALSLVGPSSRYGSTNAEILLDPGQPVVQALLKMERSERCALLNDLVWNMPALGLTKAARMNVSDPIPEFFKQALLDAKQITPPSHQLAAPGARSVSLLEWAMRDALAQGQKADILARIDALEQQGSDDAKLARLVLGLAQDQPPDLSLLTTTADDGSKELGPVLGTDSEVTSLDIAAVEYALAQPEYRDAAIKLLETLFQTALERRQSVPVMWLRYLKMQLLTERGEVPRSHHDLKHWVVSDDVVRWNYGAGHVPASLWVERAENVWGHEFGPEVSYLMLRYPIEGDFTVSFRSKDGLYEEAAVSYGGLTIESLQYLTRLQIWGVGNRNTAYVTTDAIQDEDFTTYQLARTGDALEFRIAEDFTQKLELSSQAFPFFGLCSFYHRATTFDSLKIEGDISIPRSVDLLSPDLVGWSTKFTSQRLPPIHFMPERTSGAPTPQEPEWRVVDGVLESVEQETAAAKANAQTVAQEPTVVRRQGLIQYLRPLCDGEEIALEFYHEPDKFTLIPAVGRIALELSQPQVGLHLIAPHYAPSWHGIPSEHRVVDENAKQLEPIQLTSGDWNQLAVRLDGDVLTLKINGKAVYQRAWEPEVGRQFGLFHDPTESHIRVRNVRLTGPWPEQLPTDLFE